MDRCDPRSRPLATNRAAHRAEKISAAYRNPRHRRQGIPGLRCRATPNTANLLSENRPGVTDAGVSLRRLTSRNSLTLKNFSQHAVEDGLDRLINTFSPPIALVGEVLRSRRTSADRGLLPAVSLIAPDSPFFPMQQVPQGVAIGHIGRGGQHRVNQLCAAVDSDVRFHAEVPLFPF